MSPKRAAAWTLVGALAVAWFASAAGVIRQRWRITPAPARPAFTEQADPLWFDVDAQAKRLRRRLASAPAPQPVRNPFVFAARPPAQSRPSTRVAAPAPVAEMSREVEPPLGLIGIAEDGGADALVRTAMIAGEGDQLFLVRVGQTVGRYTITAIGPDAVEMKDETTGRIRRLVLR